MLYGCWDDVVVCVGILFVYVVVWVRSVTIVFCICCVNGSNDVNLGVVVIVISVVVGIDCIVFGNY